MPAHIPGKSKGRNKGPLGRDPLPGPSKVPPAVRDRVVPPRGPPVAGVGTPPGDTDSSVLPGDLLGALKLLQTVMSAEDFSKYEKMVTPPSKEERTEEREQWLVILNRLQSLKQMQQNSGPCFKVYGNSLRL